MSKEWGIVKGKEKIDKAIKEKISKIFKEKENKKDDPTIGDTSDRDSKGRFLPGNKYGKIPQEKLYTITELEQAIKEVEEEGDKDGNKIDILKHYVRESLKDNRVMIDLIGKKIPKITINEIKGTGLPFNLFVTQFVEEKVKEKEINDRPESSES